MRPPVRVLVADDHDGVREGLCALLSDDDRLTVVAACADGLEAVVAARRLLPDVALVDLRMPVLDGLDVARALARCAPATRVVVFSAVLTPAGVQAARDAGAVGWLLKGGATAALTGAVLAVAAGDTAWCAEAARVA